MDNKININILKPGMNIKFKTIKEHAAIGKITSIDLDKNTILLHNMIYLSDFSPLRGKFGGLNIGISQFINII